MNDKQHDQTAPTQEPPHGNGSDLEAVVIRDLLAKKHTGMRISANGVLGRIRDGRYYKELNFGCGEMLRHLEEMATRFYAGDLKAVDEFLQLYDLDDNRPSV